MEHWNQSRLDFCEKVKSEDLTSFKLNFKEVSQVPTSTIANYETKKSGPILSEQYKRLELSQGQLGTIRPHHKELSQESLPTDSNSNDEAYENFYNTIFVAAKLLISRGRRNNCRRCWNVECEHLYQVFLRNPQGEATRSAVFALVSHLDKNRKIAGSRLSTTLTSHTPVGWHGI